ncbi:disease resistance protein RPV1-like isoform X2 [Tripterygium wilfordii]|uniref:disease resistance protein RPV1-like isoform X2 n=1 Tax=Tripterygium wilfordii TaxID=458696 RepID=UPI0018F8366B|nr:disease resistance protein RPV1-like isoform X2 [Tripterygium wilfordii]
MKALAWMTDSRKLVADFHIWKKGINTFRDDEALERRKSVSPIVLKAIEESRFSIIVFSRNYASSICCLDELVKIVKCMETMEQTVFPVFYDVEPSDVRKQAGKFERAFAEHEDTFKQNMERVSRWREAMTEVANLSGWALLDRHESKFIEDIVEEISVRLGQTFSIVSKELVGIDSRIRETELLLEMGLDGVRFIGICGTKGIGKTTIAQAVYDSLSCQFEGNTFLSDVGEVSERFGLVSLQQQILSDIFKERNVNMSLWNVNGGAAAIRKMIYFKKILLVVDGVDKLEQLESLAGNHDWFCEGSRIIITVRDENLLVRHGVDRIYRVERLNHDEALHLFCRKAFKKEQPENDYVELSNLFVNYVYGVPLALKVLGSFLFGRSIPEWKSALKRLEKYPDYWKSLK